MTPLEKMSLRTQKQTVHVLVPRHDAKCAHFGDPTCRRCKCWKYIYVYQGGKDKTISAKTRSWDKAELKAREIRDGMDPVKKLQRELEGEKERRALEDVTIDSALDRWLAAKKDEAEATLTKYRTAKKKIASWALSRGFRDLKDVTPDSLDHWKSLWSLKAKSVTDRMGQSTQGRLLEKIKAFFRYCVMMGWLHANPSANLKAIKPDGVQTIPLLDGRYEEVLKATYKYDQDMRPDDRFGPELRAIMELMRWSGLRVGDALLCKRSQITGNRYGLRVKKSGARLGLILPDHVIEALNNLPPRPTVDPGHFFWSGKSSYKSLLSQWERKLKRLNKYLAMKDYEGHPLDFHSHQLRDTFVVEHLLNGTSMEDVSKMIGHKSIRITEKYYSAWVPQRQAALEQKMIEGIRKMGATVTPSNS